MKSFMALLDAYSAKIVREPLTPELEQAAAVGEMFANEFIAAARAGTLPEDSLICAISVLGIAEKLVLAGFMRRITSALEAK